MGTKKINLLKAAYTPNIKVKRRLCAWIQQAGFIADGDKQTIVADIISTDAKMALSAERAPGSCEKNDQ